jgi:hypothetical protein
MPGRPGLGGYWGVSGNLFRFLTPTLLGLLEVEGGLGLGIVAQVLLSHRSVGSRPADVPGMGHARLSERGGFATRMT